jgi:hypothetical protein
MEFANARIVEHTCSGGRMRCGSLARRSTRSTRTVSSGSESTAGAALRADDSRRPAWLQLCLCVSAFACVWQQAVRWRDIQAQP